MKKLPFVFMFVTSMVVSSPCKVEAETINFCNTFSLEKNLPHEQGENNIFVYEYKNDGDYKNISELTLHSTYENGNGWWDGTVFVGPQHLGGSGIAAISYKAPGDGYYKISSKTWLKCEASDDGWICGHGKKDIEGNITFVGDYFDCSASYLLNHKDENNPATNMEDVVYLAKDEEVLFFKASKNNGNGDEVGIQLNFEEICYATIDNAVFFDGYYNCQIGEKYNVLIFGNGSYSYESCDNKIVSIDNEKITIVGEGKCNLKIVIDRKEIILNINATNNIPFDGNVKFPDGVETINGVGKLFVGEKIKLIFNNVDGIKMFSSNSEIASVNNDGEISANKTGYTCISLSKEKITTKVGVLVLEREKDNAPIYSQKSTLPSYQGENNMYVYSQDKGTIKGKMPECFEYLQKMGDSFFNEEDAWWNNKTFINSNHVFTQGVGALSYKIQDKGNYLVSYLAYLSNDIFYDKNYTSYNVDGFSSGLLLKSKNAYKVIYSEIGDKESVINLDTYVQTNTTTMELDVGDEIMFFWASNGIGDCDEIMSEFFVQRAYKPGEEPTKIVFNDQDIQIKKGQKVSLNLDYIYYHNETLIYSSSNSNVISIDENGLMTAEGIGSATISISNELNLNISKTFFCSEDLYYSKASNENIDIPIENLDDSINNFHVYMDGIVVGKNNVKIFSNYIRFENKYLNTLTYGVKNLYLVCPFGRLNFTLTIGE